VAALVQSYAYLRPSAVRESAAGRTLALETSGGAASAAVRTHPRVPLPGRWLRGFAEAQVVAAGMALRAEVSAVQAAALLRALPAPGAVCLPGVERLWIVQPVLRHATAVRLYAPASAGGEPAAVAWEFRLPGMRLVVMLSPDAWRGFSGEGGVLRDLATTSAVEDAADLLSVLPAGNRRRRLPGCRGRRACRPAGRAPR
jgi:hypothetical protein